MRLLHLRPLRYDGSHQRWSQRMPSAEPGVLPLLIWMPEAVPASVAAPLLKVCLCLAFVGGSG